MATNTTQTPAEQQALHEAWHAHPKVVAYKAAVAAFIAAETQEMTTLDAMNATLRFGNAWIAEHGMLPDAGIRTM